jgi:hypothetical protein
MTKQRRQPRASDFSGRCMMAGHARGIISVLQPATVAGKVAAQFGA